MPSDIANDQSSGDLSKAQRVYDYLRGRMRELIIPPGTRLNKNKIAIACGVSRAPVSEAIARLAGEGLVDVYPQNGSFVSPIRTEDIHEALFMRRALEVEIIRQVTRDADEDLLARLKDNVQRQFQAVEQKELDLLLLDDLDEMFHSLIITAVHSPRAQRVLNAARALLDRPRFLALPGHDRPRKTVIEHQRILDAICTGDADLAGATMRVHINAVSSAIEEILERMTGNHDDKQT